MLTEGPPCRCSKHFKFLGVFSDILSVGGTTELKIDIEARFETSRPDRCEPNV